MPPQHEPTIKTKSAALLAAEAAFAPPSQTHERQVSSALPAITVVRSKEPTALSGSAESPPSVFSDATASSRLQRVAPKVPRVFLVESAHPEFRSTAPEPSALRGTQAAEMGAVLGHEADASTPARRIKRSRSQPPPVTVVFSASAGATSAAAQAHRGEVSAAGAEAQCDPLAQRSTGLAAALAEIEPIFAAIGSASRFVVEDAQVAARWERLSRALDQVAAEIAAEPLSGSFFL